MKEQRQQSEIHKSLREMLSYSKETGEFVWVKKIANAKVGERAGSVASTGYRIINPSKFTGPILEHRLAWYFHYGVFPSKAIDHINRNRLDNRICNLREASAEENSQNICKPNKNNASGVRGVIQIKSGSFLARIYTSEKTHFVGIFKSLDEAGSAYMKAKLDLHKGYVS